MRFSRGWEDGVLHSVLHSVGTFVLIGLSFSSLLFFSSLFLSFFLFFFFFFKKKKKKGKGKIKYSLHHRSFFSSIPKTDLNWLHRPKSINHRRHVGVSAILTKPQGFIITKLSR
ncbi:uncharacterized protein EURHEDRAFT_30606 [Aspergillus ruber CBS 135680]|uniref:Uncharacterized protein n=1 Tax=Aspergillus ruber (strain CBS 135680) TaxID=1388766 RepID=A0A017SU32_ASPRC|nr:uncharacterized protein EURHEDRAFT_30606 [Aspergillus ruber CBS 135680]EYE99815.1 hypothetical protein EURHEDRAFT_30606 [Aspergillus ruber CBS 135680]